MAIQYSDYDIEWAKGFDEILTNLGGTPPDDDEVFEYMCETKDDIAANVYYQLVLSRIESKIEEKYPDAEVSYYVNARDTKLYINGEQVYDWSDAQPLLTSLEIQVPFGTYTYEESDDPDAKMEDLNEAEVKEFIIDHNKDFETNYKSVDEFNEGEEYREFTNTEFAKGGQAPDEYTGGSRVLGYVAVLRDMKSSYYKDMPKKGDILPFTKENCDRYDVCHSVIAWYKGRGNEYSLKDEMRGLYDGEVEYTGKYFAKGGEVGIKVSIPQLDFLNNELRMTIDDFYDDEDEYFVDMIKTLREKIDEAYKNYTLNLTSSEKSYLSEQISMVIGEEEYGDDYYLSLKELEDLQNKLDSYAKGGETDDVIMIEIGADKKYPYYIKKIDTTHIAMANNKDGVDLVIPSHILQHKGESYYDDVRSWLKGGQSPDGKSYDSDYYAKGGKVITDSFGDKYELREDEEININDYVYFGDTGDISVVEDEEDLEFARAGKTKAVPYAKGGSIRRTNSPLLRYTNYEDGWRLNLLKLNPLRNQDGLRYKGNYKYGISRQGPGTKQEVWQFETLKEADKKYDELVDFSKTYSKIDKKGKIEANYEKGGKIGDDFKVGDNVIVRRKDGKRYKGKIEKLGYSDDPIPLPLTIRTSPTDTMVFGRMSGDIDVVSDDSYAKGGEIKEVDVIWRKLPTMVKIRKIKKTDKGGYSGLFHYEDEDREKWERLNKYNGRSLWDRGVLPMSYAKGGMTGFNKFFDKFKRSDAYISEPMKTAKGNYIVEVDPHDKETSKQMKDYMQSEGIGYSPKPMGKGFYTQFAKGGKIKEKENNEMIMGGLAGILLGIFLNK